ncbi:MAG: hypothetical protein ACM3Q2_08700, partial [Syntrophothermus sp.]
MRRVLRLLIFLMLMLSPAINLYPQQPLFTVIASGGKALYLSHNLADWTDITTGSRLYQGDRIKLDSGGYLGLCCTNGRTVELNSPGIFEAGELSKKLAAENNSITKKWTEYILNEMVTKNRTKEMKTLAGVVRHSLAYIDKDFPASTYVGGRSVEFRWFPAEEATSYIFEIMNPEGRTILMGGTPDTSITVDLEALDLVPGICYSWYVSDGGNEAAVSDTGCIKIMPRAEMIELDESLLELTNDLRDSESPLNHMIIGSFYEDKGMYTDALFHYEKAIEKGSGIEDYRKK